MKYNYLKTILSKVIAIIGIILFFIIFWWWIFIINFIITKGHPIFIQIRIGQLHRPFKLYKFRTLPLDANPYIAQYNCHTKETAFGKFLRQHNLDETLQLINILKGDMCFIGPRPVIAQEQALIECRDKYNVYYLKPGITGYSQLQKFNDTDYKTKALYDAHYLANFGFKQDVIIFLKSFSHMAQII